MDNRASYAIVGIWLYCIATSPARAFWRVSCATAVERGQIDGAVVASENYLAVGARVTANVWRLLRANKAAA